MSERPAFPSSERPVSREDQDERVARMEQRLSARADGGAIDGRDASAQAGQNKGSTDADAVVLELDAPEWVKLVLAVTGISSFQLKIQKEREKRANQTYQNPFQEVYVVVSSLRFEAFSAFLIVCNCLMIGFEITIKDKGGFEAVENLFVFVFLVEWCLRVCAFGWVWLFELFSIIDTFLVWGTGVIPMWVLQPMGMGSSDLRILTVFRALRLGRLVRIVRMIPQCKELWFLMQGLANSFRPLVWTICLAVVMLFIFGIAATELIGRQDDFQDDEYVQERFGDTLASMFTLFQLMTLDTWAYTIARPVMAKDWNMCFFFVGFITISVFVYWNLITAVIVGSAMEMAAKDGNQQAKTAEITKKQQIKVLADTFLELDTDGSGELTHKEFMAAVDVPKVQHLFVLLGYKLTETEDLWRILDDGDGHLTIKEFTTGLRRMRGEAKAKDISDIIKRLRHSSLHYTDISSQVGLFNTTIGALERDVERIQSDTGEILSLFQEMYHRLQAHIEREASEDRAIAKRRAKMREMSDDMGEDMPMSATDSPPGSP